MAIKRHINAEIWASKTEDDILYGLMDLNAVFKTYMHKIYKSLNINDKVNRAKSLVYQGKAKILGVKFKTIKNLKKGGNYYG